jgi:hypothetical protein
MRRPNMPRSASRMGVALAVVLVMVASSVLLVVAETPAGPSAGVAVTSTAAAAGTTPNAGVSLSSAPSGVLGLAAARAATVRSDEAAYLAGGGNASLFLPPNLHQAPALAATSGHVIPLYSVAPAPMGVAYYGLSNTNGTVVPTTLNTTSLEATFSTGDPLGVQTEEFDFGSQNSYGAQLNAVLTNVTLFGENSYGPNPNAPVGCANATAPNGSACPNEFWLQNVIGYSDATHSLSFENNIWNFSNPTSAWTTGTNALMGFSSPRGGFYAVNGPAITIAYPFTLALYLNTTRGPCHTDSTPGTGVPSCGTVSTTAPVNEVFFNYSVWNSAGQHVCPTSAGTGKVCGEYDDVFFNSVNPSVNPGGVPQYGPNGRVGSATIQANGSAYDPVGLTNDFEMDWGIGTSSGATNNVVYADATVGINYCPAANTLPSGACTAYGATPAAYGYGGETGETATGSSVYWAPQGSPGVGSTLLSGSGTPVAHLVTGPSLLRELWNGSGAAYPAGAGGNALNYGGISPANAWVGIAAGSGVTNQSEFQVAPTFGWFSGWAGSGGAPTPTTLGKNLYLTPGAYTVEVLLSGYTPYIGTVNLATSGQTPTIALTANASTGVYTPLWAFSRGDLNNISSNAGSFGIGGLSNAYRLDNAKPTVGAPFGVPGSLSWLFSNTNDYLFTVWIGEYLNDTTAYSQANPAASFLMDYPSWQAPSFALFDVPTVDQFQLYYFDVQNFTLAGSANITSWANSEATTLYSVVCNGCKNVLIADNTFRVSDRGLEFLNGGATAPSGAALTDTRNVVWGNTFQPYPQPSFLGLTAPSTGLVLSESFDRVYNNAFSTNGTATASGSNLDFWNVTCVPGYNPLGAATYPGPTVCEPASYTTSYLGFSLTGSLTGTSYQGGNSWFNYGNAANPYGNIPYVARSSSVTGSAGIAATANPYRGDYAPLLGFTVYDPTFFETGIPSSTSTTAFEVRVVSSTGAAWLNATQTTTLSAVCGGVGCVVFYLPTGSYTYDGLSGLTGASASAANPATGTFAISGAPVGTVTTFAFGAAHAVTFTETGLPAGTHWSVAIPGEPTGTSSGTTIVFSLPNGGYTYTVSTVAGYETTQLGSFSVSGAAVGISVPFVVATYPVTFTETGLPNGVTWYTNLSGGPSLQATVSGASGTSVSASLANGSYAFTVATNDQRWMPSASSPVVVDGAGVGVPVTFSEVTYGVTYSETGLPAGQTWAVTFDGVPMPTLTDGATDSLTFAAEPNGTYAYAIADVPGWHESTLPYSGTASVNGGPLAETVVFSEVTYGVAFNESGLPSGQTWSVTFNGGTASTVTDGGTDSVSFAAVPNGSYNYSIADVSGWHESGLAYSGSVTVAGGFLAESVTFSQVTNTVTFTESGLPSGTTWYANGSWGSLSATVSGVTGTSVSTELANGTYSYSVASANRSWSAPTPAPLVVTGPESVGIPFSLVSYLVTFTESGLPAGTNWSVTLGGATESGTGSVIVFAEPNGTYAYTIGTVRNYSTTSSGTTTVDGAPVGVGVAFAPVTYLVTFHETGLPAGTSWSVTVGATTVSGTTASLKFHLMNGTYGFSVSNVPNYSRTASGTISVVGTPLTVTETFTLVTYKVSFHETGLPAGTSWSVTVGTKTASGTTATLTMKLANGSYTYHVANVPNYSRTPSGSLAVAGSGPTVTVHFTLVKYKVTFTESGLPLHTSWQVTIGSVTVSSTTKTLTFSLANGTWAYSVAAPGSGYGASGGNVTVNGSATGVSVTFQLGGLPAGVVAAPVGRTGGA